MIVLAFSLRIHRKAGVTFAVEEAFIGLSEKFVTATSGGDNSLPTWSSAYQRLGEARSPFWSRFQQCLSIIRLRRML